MSTSLRLAPVAANRHRSGKPPERVSARAKPRSPLTAGASGCTRCCSFRGGRSRAGPLHSGWYVPARRVDQRRDARCRGRHQRLLHEPVLDPRHVEGVSLLAARKPAHVARAHDARELGLRISRLECIEAVAPLTLSPLPLRPLEACVELPCLSGNKGKCRSRLAHASASAAAAPAPFARESGLRVGQRGPCSIGIGPVRLVREYLLYSRRRAVGRTGERRRASVRRPARQPAASSSYTAARVHHAVHWSAAKQSVDPCVAGRRARESSGM